jgi:soluble cytochrome b562
MEPLLFISALIALFSLFVSVFTLATLLAAMRRPPNAAVKSKRKKSPQEREAEKEARLYREGVENILGYWPIEKEGKETEDGKQRDFQRI